MTLGKTNVIPELGLLSASFTYSHCKFHLWLGTQQREKDTAPDRI
jgi:hypothetical protein